MPKPRIHRFVALLACCSAGLAASGPGTGHGIDVGGMDRSIKVKSPADMYSFANGVWFDQASIPADKAYVGTLDEVEEHNLAILKAIVERAAIGKKHFGSSPSDLVGDLYTLAMDESRLERLGGKPLEPELHRIDEIQDRQGVLDEIAHLHTMLVPAGFAVDVRLDETDRSRMVLSMSAKNLIMSDRSLYVDMDDRSKAIRAQYVTTIGRLMELARIGDPPGQAKAALGVERSMAQALPPGAASSDLDGNFHLMTPSALANLAPNVAWSRYFRGLGAAQPRSVNVEQSKYLAAFSKALADIPLSEWRSYLRMTVLYAWAPYLSNSFVKTQFSLSSDLTGSILTAPRWKRAIRGISSVLGEALEQLYVAAAFSQDAKQSARHIVENIRAAFRDRIRSLDWMTPDTQALALKKLDALTAKIGAPESWQDYSHLKLVRDSYFDSVQRAAEFTWSYRIASLSAPADRSHWIVDPSSARVTYSPIRNEITVPAGALQHGQFDLLADDASNYGEIGFLVAREMTQGFNDNGARYDAKGRLAGWWTAGDRELFDDAASNIERQYNAYQSPEGLRVDGKLTLRENIADIGGLAIAYAAYHKALGKGNPPQRDGLTGDQRFFVAFAQHFRAHYRPDVAQVMIVSDPYAPDAVRVLGSLTDQPEFYKSFGLAVPKYLPRVW